jgi:hypothetical protein
LDYLGKQLLTISWAITDSLRQEWKNHLRSAIHPTIFAIVYWIAAGVSWVLRLPPSYRADLLVAAPKLAEGAFAAAGDYYTWKLGERVYGTGSNEAWAAVCSIDPKVVFEAYRS